MTLDPRSLRRDFDLLEAIEKATLRLVVQAIYDYCEEAIQIFAEEVDLVKDIGEDISREALDRLGTSVIPVRLFGNIDYKRARYIFLPEFSVRQALLVDSKAEKLAGAGTAIIQMSQTSMRVRQIRHGRRVNQKGGVPEVINRNNVNYLATTIFVKYNYEANSAGDKELDSIAVIALPNGILQARYNPSPKDGFWRAGRNAPTLSEPFRVRIGLSALKRKSTWCVQRIQVRPHRSFAWED